MSEKASMPLQFEHKKPNTRMRTRNRETNRGVEKTDGGANVGSELGRGLGDRYNQPRIKTGNETAPVHLVSQNPKTAAPFSPFCCFGQWTDGKIERRQTDTQLVTNGEFLQLPVKRSRRGWRKNTTPNARCSSHKNIPNTKNEWRVATGGNN